MSDNPYIKPCPFCGAHFELNETMSKRRAKLFIHPEQEPRCIAESIALWSEDAERIAAWNRRATPASEV